MTRLAIVLILLLSAPASAQDLPSKPEPRKETLTAVPGEVFPAIPDGMVWVPRGKVWHAEEVSSCFWCAEPMSFKQAAFDKKMSLMWLGEIALMVTDVELNQTCVSDGRCKEGNAFLGAGSRGRQYGIRLPVIAGAWMGTAWLRKGDKGLKIGGMKRWWILPMLYQGMSTAGIATGIHAKIAGVPTSSKARPAPEPQF